MKLIVVHCAAVPNGRTTTVEDIDQWHRDRGFQRNERWRRIWNPHLTSIGYHYVIYADSSVHSGRHEEEQGAHAAGYNKDSIGVCMIGTDAYTFDQWLSLKAVIRNLQNKYPTAEVVGHGDLPGVNKICPGFDVAAWMGGNEVAMAGHVSEGVA